MTSSTSDRGLTERLRHRASELGFQAFGVTGPDAAPLAAARLRAWLDEGCHGDMLWMEATADRRSSPGALWRDVRSVVMLGMSYAPAVDPQRHAERASVGAISVYALGSDYHKLLKSRLKALAGWLLAEAGEAAAEAKVFVDTAPVLEKPLAQAAGLGWQGKHTNLVSRSHGSWLFLGALYTSLPLGPEGSASRSHCGSCSACLEACPTDAFPAPYRLDARRCISYLTIEHKGPIPLEFRERIGNRIYGCDECLAVCPWNRFAAAARELAFMPRAELAAAALGDILQLDDASFREIFAGSPIKRVGRDRLVRNALIAAGNSGDAALGPLAEALLDDDAPIVRGAAAWALLRLDSSAWSRHRPRRLLQEPDEEVRSEWSPGTRAPAAASADRPAR
jgi:epoxyqueuosine reductase